MAGVEHWNRGIHFAASSFVLKDSEHIDLRGQSDVTSGNCLSWSLPSAWSLSCNKNTLRHNTGITRPYIKYVYVIVACAVGILAGKLSHALCQHRELELF